MADPVSMRKKWKREAAINRHLDSCPDCLGAVLYAKSEPEQLAAMCQEGRILREEASRHG